MLHAGHISREPGLGMEALEDTPSNVAVTARLKWFDHRKGFGFVEPEDGDYDAFLHISTLKRAGVEKLGEGACLLCRIERGSPGARVTEVVRVLNAAESTDPPDRPSVSETPGGGCFYLTGTVKWYDPGKGFGFVMADDGLKDVFIHKYRLARLGLSSIEPGAPIRMNVRITAKGGRPSILSCWMKTAPFQETMTVLIRTAAIHESKRPKGTHFHQKRRRDVEFIKPANTLKAKVGYGGLSADILIKAQALLENSAVDFQPLAELYLATMRARD